MTCVSLSRRFVVCATLCLIPPVVASAQEALPIGSAIDSTSSVQPADERVRSEQESPASTLSLGATIKGLPRDVWNAVSFDTAKIAGVGLGAALAAHRSDSASLEEFQENARFRGFVRPGNTYGSFAVQAGGALGTYLIGRWSDQPRIAQVGLDVIRAQVVTQAWVQAAKLSINRERPDGTPFSFPSGHVASSFATAGIVQREFGWKVGLPMYGLGTYVAAARVAQNHHYLSDVIFGAAVGLASAHSLRISHGTHTLQVSPGVVGAGVGVNFSLERRH